SYQLIEFTDPESMNRQSIAFSCFPLAYLSFCWATMLTYCRTITSDMILEACQNCSVIRYFLGNSGLRVTGLCFPSWPAVWWSITICGVANGLIPGIACI